MSTPVYIVAAQRTPMGAFLGELSSCAAPTLGATAIRAAITQSGLSPEAITQGLVDEVLMGCVLQAGVGQAPARQALRLAGLPDSTGALTINKVCGSGMKAVMLGATAIRAGEANVMVAGGMESMSQAPYYLTNARTGFRMGNQAAVDGMIHDGLWDPYNSCHMGNAGEVCAKHFGFTREAQDAYALTSTQRAIAAQQSGKFSDETAPVSIPSKKGAPVVVSLDEQPRLAKPDKLPGLRPAFDKAGTITAGNASSINDGAAALVLASEAAVKAHGLKPLARILGSATHSQDPLWFTTAPVGAIQKNLAALSLSVGDIDLFEINEAFAVVAMAAIQELGLSADRVNIHGGAVALGHPIGASGARLLVTLLHALRQQDKTLGLASLCIGGGEAVSMVIERLA